MIKMDDLVIFRDVRCKVTATDESQTTFEPIEPKPEMRRVTCSTPDLQLSEATGMYFLPGRLL